MGVGFNFNLMLCIDILFLPSLSSGDYSPYFTIIMAFHPCFYVNYVLFLCEAITAGNYFVVNHFERFFLGCCGFVVVVVVVVVIDLVHSR